MSRRERNQLFAENFIRRIKNALFNGETGAPRGRRQASLVFLSRGNSKLSRLYKMGKGSNVVGASYSVSACAVLSTRIWV